LTDLSTPLNWFQSTSKPYTLIARPELRAQVGIDWFEPEFWQEKGAVAGLSHGRYITYFVSYQMPQQPELNMVLRHYYRGGLIQKISKDKFVYTGLHKTRAVAELIMLEKMRELGLPVPKPIAARVERVGLFNCRNDILIETIKDAVDGFKLLKKSNLSSDTWFNIGATIRRFHVQGVYHSDLNIHNILIDRDQQVYVIDLDRCEFREPSDDWQQQNLQRLQRSLNKEKGLFPDFNYANTDWQQLMAGYNS